MSSSAYLPSRAEREAALDPLLRAIDDFWDTVPDRPIGPANDAASRAAWLREFDFASPIPLDRLAAETFAQVAGGTLLSQHPRCFGLFNPTPSFPGVLADVITAAVNPQLAVSSHAPIAVEIERHVTDAVCRRIGLPAGAEGHFTSGGAEANLTATICALTANVPGFDEWGARAATGPLTLYASAESHFAWYKIAHTTGIGRQAVRLIETDGTGRMNAEALAHAIEQDRAQGTHPFMVVATAGTTNAGMIDPLEATAAIAQAQGLWFHVDSAWAGAAIASTRASAVLAGLEQADSITIDAHKWFSVPMGAGMYFTRRGDVLGEAFRVAASYMPSADAAIDPYLRTAQWSRRLIGLKLFMTLAAAGWEGVGATVDHQLAMADLLATRLAADGWQIANSSPVGVVCFEDPSLPIDAVVSSVQASQRAWISLAKFEGRPVARACITSFRTTQDDVEALVGELGRARHAVASR